MNEFIKIVHNSSEYFGSFPHLFWHFRASSLINVTGMVRSSFSVLCTIAFFTFLLMSARRSVQAYSEMVISSNIFAIENGFSYFLSNLEHILDKILVEWLEIFLLVVLTNVYFFTFFMELSEQECRNLCETVIFIYFLAIFRLFIRF